jgi:hypothetical protein
MTELKRRHDIFSELDGRTYLTRSYWAIVGPKAAVVYVIMGRCTQEQMHDFIMNGFPPWEAMQEYQGRERIRSLGIDVHVPSPEKEHRRCCDWFESPCEVYSADIFTRVKEMTGEIQPLYYAGEEMIYQELTGIYLRHVQTWEESRFYDHGENLHSD